MSEGQGRAPQGAAAGTLYHEYLCIFEVLFSYFCFYFSKIFPGPWKINQASVIMLSVVTCHMLFVYNNGKCTQ